MSAERGARTDAALVAAVGGGAQQALAELYRRHGGAVWNLSLRVCRDESLAEDVCQVVFCELWSSPQRFDPGRGGFRSWLLALAHARAVDAVRSEEARRRREDLAVAATATSAWDVEVEADLAVLAKGVRDAVGTLPEGERAAILLTYFGGHSYREAALLLGQAEGTVKSRIRSGLRKLRGELAGAGVTP